MSSVRIDLTDVVVFAVTVLLCLVVLNSRNSILNRRATKDLRQRHATHARPAPRLGGAVIFASFLLTTLFFDGYFGGRHAKVIVAMLPMVAITLWEDMVRPTPPRVRLLAVIASSLFTIAATQVWLPTLNVPYLDLARLRCLPALKDRATWHNPLATLLVLPVALTPMIFAASYYDQPRTLQVGAVAYAVAMIVLYVALRAGVKGSRQTSEAVS